MTFRPSDDILDQISDNKQSFSYNSDDGNYNDGQYSFNKFEKNEHTGAPENIEINSEAIDSSEEIKAPDLSDLLKDDGDVLSQNEKTINKQENKDLNKESLIEGSELGNLSSVKSDSQNMDKTMANIEEVNFLYDEGENKIDTQGVATETEAQQSEQDYLNLDKMSDSERSEIVSSITGAINSNLDFLVDDNRINIINSYKKLNRLFCRWGAFIFVMIIGIVSGIFFQVKASTSGVVQIFNDSLIENRNQRIDETPDKLLSSSIDSEINVDVVVPYGSISFDGTLVNSKSNLISYKGIVLPQLFSMDYSLDDLISLTDFISKNVTRADIKNLIDTLITKNSIYTKTTNIPNVNSLKWKGNKFPGSLKDGFNLYCLGYPKVSDFVCDKFLENFYEYGKYYDLSEYSEELLSVISDLRSQSKNISPICNMVKDYTLHVGNTSENLISIMDYCGEDAVYYKKLINFIELDSSLSQPMLSSKVYDDPDLNAYKLLSAQQSVYRILDGTSLNEGYIKSYLDFVQSLLDKDNGNNRYLHPIYKDILYVFNIDVLYQKLLDKGRLSSDLSLKIDQINNGNNFGSISLLSQLTTSDIVQQDSDISSEIANQKSLEDLFSQYYAMTDRLKIRKVNIVSDDEIKVQTEIFTDKILGVTDGQTLKATVVLYRQNDLLYVDSIKIANQPKFTDILAIYLKEGNVTFYAMLNYIDEQVGMWYEVASENYEEQPDFCEELMQRENIDVYVCDDSSISLYKGDIGYDFIWEDGILVSFTITDENLDRIIKDKLEGVLFMKDSTPSMITSIIDFSIESEDGNLEKKIEIIDQFRIHFKIVPNYVYDVEGKSDVFLVDFTLGDFDLQGYYDVNTQVLSKISYTDCPKPLEIKQLTLEITAENETKLIEILNNPRVFFASVNPLIYNKHKNACGGNTLKKK